MKSTYKTRYSSLLLTALLGVTVECPAARLDLVARKNPTPGYTTYQITNMEIAPGDFHLEYQTPPTKAYIRVYAAPATYLMMCGYPASMMEYKCMYGAAPTEYCNTREDAVARAQQFVGLGVQGDTRKGAPAQWGFGCRSKTENAWWSTDMLPANGAPALVSCTSSSAEVRLIGRVGAELTDSTNVSIHCDSEASLKLSIPNGGMVNVGGEGEVQLKFQASGKDVLNVTGTDPLVRIDGELTKSPTTAGTYKGSTVLLLDVL